MTDRVDLDEGTRLRAAVARGVCSIIEADALEAWTVNNFPSHRDETLALREAVAKVRELAYASDDGTEYEHATIPNCGEPECPACWAQGIRAALEGLPE